MELLEHKAYTREEIINAILSGLAQSKTLSSVASEIYQRDVTWLLKELSIARSKQRLLQNSLTTLEQSIQRLFTDLASHVINEVRQTIKDAMGG